MTPRRLKHLASACASIASALLFTPVLPAAPAFASTGVHTSYLWHMHQPIYWPDRSAWDPARYETAYETITLGNSQNDESAIFGKADRVADYQWYPKDAVSSISDLPEAGAQVSFAGALIENLFSLGDNGWSGGAYASDWYSHYRTARSWTNTKGQPRLEPLLVGFHHAIAPLMDDNAFRMELACAKAIYDDAWGDTSYSKGFFPAEMCFSERLIPALVDAGIDWSIVGDLHLARACADYPWSANLDNCDPPNRADRTNPAQGTYTNHFISRGVTLKVPYPFGFTPHKAEYVDPATGAVSTITVVPAANAMSWEEGFGTFGTGGIDAIAPANDPARPMLVLFAHDGDNAWSGGYSYYNENVTNFSHAADAAGYTPTTIATYLADHPVPANDVVHVEDGGWVNADGDFGSPQFINWNWPLVDAGGEFDIPGGWAEDERNWAVLTAAQNRVETAEAIGGAPDPANVVDPSAGGTTAVERAWHFLLAGYESGYMYYGSSLDMEVKPTLACNEAVSEADPVIAGGSDATAPTVWLPQRLPWNPGGFGGGSLWGYPGGQGAPHDTTFHVWTFAYDVSGLARVELMIREDLDGANDPASHQNETYAGGAEVGAWTAVPMNYRDFPADEPYDIPGIDFTELPDYIADQYWTRVTGYSDVLLDYYVEAEDSLGHVKRTPIQHVYVGTGSGGGGPSNTVWWTPEEPAAGDTLCIRYDAAGGALAAADTVLIHLGTNGWQGVADYPMIRSAPDSAWKYAYPIPATASVVDLVFTDGAGTWDNNGGADWHVDVTGAAGPPFVIDGQLDAGATMLATGNGLSLWGAFDGEYVYLATNGTAATTGADHFVFVALDTAATGAAPWAKSGSSVAWDHLLAAEEGSGWSGWFDAGENVVTGPALDQAHGAVLEGTLRPEALYGSVPATIWVAAAGYETADAGALLHEAPLGDGDGDLEPVEFHPFPLIATGVSESGVPRATPALALAPNPFNPHTVVRLELARSGRIKLGVFDVRGRLVRTLFDGRSDAGSHAFAWNGLDEGGRAVSSGVYFFRAATVDGEITKKGILLR